MKWLPCYDIITSNLYQSAYVLMIHHLIESSWKNHHTTCSFKRHHHKARIANQLNRQPAIALANRSLASKRCSAIVIITQKPNPLGTGFLEVQSFIEKSFCSSRSKSKAEMVSTWLYFWCWFLHVTKRNAARHLVYQQLLLFRKVSCYFDLRSTRTEILYEHELYRGIFWMLV